MNVVIPIVFFAVSILFYRKTKSLNAISQLRTIAGRITTFIYPVNLSSITARAIILTGLFTWIEFFFLGKNSAFSIISFGLFSFSLQQYYYATVRYRLHNILKEPKTLNYIDAISRQPETRIKLLKLNVDLILCETKDGKKVYSQGISSHIGKSGKLILDHVGKRKLNIFIPELMWLDLTQDYTEMDKFFNNSQNLKVF